MRGAARGIVLVLGVVLTLALAAGAPPAAAGHWDALEQEAIDLSNQGRHREAVARALAARDAARAEEGTGSEAYQSATLSAASVSVGAGDLARARSLAREAEALAPANPVLRARLLTTQAEIALAEGRHEEAARLNRQALEMAEGASTSDAFRSAIANRLGRALKRAGRHEEAERAYRQALDLALAAGDAGKEWVALNNLGLLYYDAGDLARAEKYLKQAVDLARRRVNAMGRDTANSYTGLAKVYLELGRPRQAEALLHEALGLVSRNGILDTVSGYNVLLNLCVALNDLSRPAEAETYCRKAASVARNLGPWFQVEPRLHLARALSLQGRSLTARRALDQGLAAARRAGDPVMLAVAHQSAGLFHLRQRRLKQARREFLAALEALPPDPDPAHRAASLAALGQTELLDGKAARALELFEQADALRARARPESSDRMSSLQLRAVAHHRLGQADKARALYRQALALARRLGDAASARLLEDNLRRLDAGQPPDLGALAEVGR